MHPSKQQLALDFIRRGARDLAAAQATLDRYVSLAIRYDCDRQSIDRAIAQALPEESSRRQRHVA